MTHRCGTVAMVGRPNTGKSSLLNRLVGEKLSIVSARPQTTRHLVTGILTRPGCQYIFIDAPGNPPRLKSVLHKALNRRVAQAASQADVVLFVVEAPRFGAEDQAALERIPAGQKVIAVANKLDLLKRSADLIPFLERLSRTRDFAALVPVSARTGRNLPELLRVIAEALPEGAAAYPEDQLTDRDERFFAAEALREMLFETLGEELPYRCEVMIDSFKEEGRLRRIEATILVERDSQKGIVLGSGGARLKQMASAARKDLERLYQGKVYLGVWVKVRRAWTDDARVLRQLGYE
ncbi:MAG: GTPase Era [Betaproteobacteria bacterium]|nr:MAG: GTPase Era [Betaproteobacteria bacterium]